MIFFCKVRNKLCPTWNDYEKNVRLCGSLRCHRACRLAELGSLMEYKGNAPLQFFGAAFVAIGLWRIIKKWRDS